MTWGVRGLDVVFRTGHGHVVRALAGVDLDLPHGQVTSVVGGDGAGKTTLVRALLGQAPVAGGAVDAPSRDRIGYQPSSSGVSRINALPPSLGCVRMRRKPSSPIWPKPMLA